MATMRLERRTPRSYALAHVYSPCEAETDADLALKNVADRAPLDSPSQAFSVLGFEALSRESLIAGEASATVVASATASQPTQQEKA